jgi:murein peptide amidase A
VRGPRTLIGASALLLTALMIPPSSASGGPPHQAAAPALAGAAAARHAAKPAVVSKRVIGTSVNDHPIRAWELGDRDAKVTAILFGAHHGDETAGQTVLNTLRDGNPVHGVHVWVVPRLNPDGVLRGTRQNARGVDLNRNFPRKWKPLTGYNYSGPRPASEPETRAAMRFMDRIDPDYVVSIHTPLYGLDVKRAKDRAFARRLSQELNLPDRQLRCNGTCHGTLSQWFNFKHKGACSTIEFGASPSAHYLTVKAPRGLIRALGGTRGGGPHAV